MINLSSFYPVSFETGSLVYTTGNQNINGIKNFSQRPRVNNTGVLLIGEAGGESSQGIYQAQIDINSQEQYLKTSEEISKIDFLADKTLKNGDIINLQFGSLYDESAASRTIKVDPWVFIDKIVGAPFSRNYLYFTGESPYVGKAIRKIRYNSTIGNDYTDKINLTNLSSQENPVIIKPKTRHIESFYEINVPSGGGIRYIKFSTPNSFPFVNAQSLNLKFKFEADNSPCIIRGFSISDPTIFLSLTGANYSFIQKERVILVSKGGDGNISEFKHW